uniref:Kazal-like domain-containing protein n=1 Tax=Gopherus agassizii TaxID=38772 RepID=A0A452I2R1_9SAUR
MKTAGTFVFLALASFCCFSGDGRFYCNRDNNPVRGPDGETHTNKCVMCRKMIHSESSTEPPGTCGFK